MKSEYYRLSKYLIILFFSIFQGQLTISQALVFDSIPKTIKEYNRHVNLAEISLIDGYYKKAISHYGDAFSIDVYAPAIDVFNAAVCMVKVSQFDDAFLLLKEILKKGYSIRNIENDNTFNEFFHTEIGLQLKDFARNVPYNYDMNLRSTIDSLYMMDQLFRKKKELGNPYDFFEDTINRIDDLNRDILESIIDTLGFPGEELIGLSDSSLTYQPYSIVLIHLQQISTGRRRGEVENISEIVMNAYCSGRLPVHEAAYLLELASADFGSFSSSLFKIIYLEPGNNTMQIPEDEIRNKEWGYYELKDQKKEIDKDRLNFGLETVDDYRKKLIFKLNESTFDFNKIKSGYNIMSTTNKQQYDYSNGNLIPIR